MHFYGGISTIVHLAIIGFKWARQYPRSFAVVCLVGSVVVGSGAFIVAQSVGEFSNISTVAFYLHRCKPAKAEAAQTNQYIILRLDDVQGHLWSDISMKMIKESEKRGIPLVLGLIPLRLEEDKELWQFLRFRRCNMEFALHGWNHSEDRPEFGDIDEHEAAEKLAKGMLILRKLTGEQTSTFIPPNNTISPEAATAVYKSGMAVISSEGEQLFDYDTSTYDFGARKLVSVNAVVRACATAIALKDKCVIMLHPQDYATNGLMDQNKYKAFIALLDSLEQLGAEFITITGLFRIIEGNPDLAVP